MAEAQTDMGGSSAPQQTASSQPSRGVFLPFVFGGAVACALGFFAAQIEGVEAALGLSEQEKPLAEVVAAQKTRLDEQSALIEAQKGQIAGLAQKLDNVPAPVDVSPIEEANAALASSLNALTQRLGELEKRPMTDNVSREAIAAYEAELDRLKSEVKAQRDEIAAMMDTARNSETEAQRHAQMALARAAATRIVAAVESGAPFMAALTDLETSFDADIPAPLTNSAESGVPTLAHLQDGFPPVARDALAAARAETAASGETGVGAFLRRQLGARSVTPQEGDDADAILSRVEAAIREGRLSDALAETATLPEVAQATMADWLAQTQMRHDAIAAAQELMAALSAN